MLTTMTRAQMEARRMQAVELLRAGWKVTEVAHKFDVTPSAVSHWKTKWKELGKRALATKPHSGRPPKLNSTQKQQLVDHLDRGAKACGFDTDDWTCPRVQQFIAKTFDVHYHVDHLSRLLRNLGYSPQRPKRRSQKYDGEAIKTWRRREWPRIKKGG